jgi:hypothetical protein
MNWLSTLLAQLAQAAVDWINRCIPAYDPADWNADPHVQQCNNCYNYACNIRTDTFAQPGYASGAQYTNLDCGDVGPAAVRDGLVATTSSETCGCTDCSHLVCLVMAPGDDFHWYRRGPDGYWTHKPGGTPATNVDDNGNLITDPRTAARGPYTVVCGFYCVPKSSVHIDGSRPAWC